jgi:precorrin-2 dehydrogenase/sirohydrochlorin ferrochelatase
VEVISLHFAEDLLKWALNEPLHLTEGEYTPQILQGAFLVVGATNDQGVNGRIAADARHLRVLCNIVDQPELSDFVVPAVARQGEVTIAVSTSGKSPALARRIRDQIVQTIPTAYTTLAQILGALRVHHALTHCQADDHKRIWEALLDSPILNWIEAGDTQSIERQLESILGHKVTLEDLGVKLNKRSRNHVSNVV